MACFAKPPAKHDAPITLIHGARTPRSVPAQSTGAGESASNVTYHPVVLSDDGTTDDGTLVAPARCRRLMRSLKTRFAKLSGQRAFLCGDAELVGQLRKQVFCKAAVGRHPG